MKREGGYTKADLRWQAVVAYHQRIARAHGLISSPGPQPHGLPTWNLRLFDIWDEGEESHYPYALVEPHRVGRAGMCSVTIHRGLVKDNLVRPAELDHVLGFRNACILAFPLLQAYDAANRLSGAVPFEIEL